MVLSYLMVLQNRLQVLAPNYRRVIKAEQLNFILMRVLRFFVPRNRFRCRILSTIQIINYSFFLILRNSSVKMSVYVVKRTLTQHSARFSMNKIQRRN